MEEIAPNTVVETAFYGGNVAAIITDEGIVCINTPPLPNEARRWRSQLAHLTAKPIAMVINTSHSPMRLLGNRWFNAPVMAHQHTNRIIAERPELYRPLHVLPETHDSLPELTGIRPTAAELTFTEAVTVFRGGQRIDIWRRSGASAGGAWVHLPDPDLTFIGDTVPGPGHPLLYSADLDQWLLDLQEIARRPDHLGRIVPGHGPLDAPLDDAIETITAYIVWLRSELRHLAEKGTTTTNLLNHIPAILDQFPVQPDWRGFTITRLTASLPYLYERITTAMGVVIDDVPPSETTE